MASTSRRHRLGRVRVRFEAVLQATGRALLVRFAGGRALWVPLSQVGNAAECRPGAPAGVIVLSEWFVKERGMT